MKLIRLNKNSFIRNYENIGYLYNQVSRKDLVFDDIGAEFLLNIGRIPITIDKIVKLLTPKFRNTSKLELETDFIEFAIKLEKEGFLITGNTLENINKKELSEFYDNPQPTSLYSEKMTGDSKSYLKTHFKNYPRPFRAQIELTTQCNLKCIHCYLPQNNNKYSISKDAVFSCLDQLKLMGSLEIIFTGGEVLLYKDLIEVLTYARNKDFSVMLLTNGSLLGSEVIKALGKINLALVQVSMYSMKPDIHDKITGVAGSWERTKYNIDHLINNDIRVEIACPIIKENAESFPQVAEYGKTLGIAVSNDLAIMAREDFSLDNLDHRIDINEIQDIVKRRNQYKSSEELSESMSRRFCPEDPVCGMGLSLICLAANGDFYPCPGFKMSLGNINRHTVKEIWEGSPGIISLRKVTNASFVQCMKCEYLDYCTICPAKFYNGSEGDMFKIDEYFCEIARAEKESLSCS